MSTVFSTARARVASATQTVTHPVSPGRPEPKLRIVYGAPFRPPRMPFVLFVVALLAAGLVGLLLLNTELQGGTFRVTELNQQADQLRDQQEQLERQVRTLESPQNLAERALRMGMVPNPNPVFLRLSDGKVLGVPTEGEPGGGREMFGPDPVPKPPGTVPSGAPTTAPTGRPTGTPTGAPTAGASPKPSTKPSTAPSTKPSTKPSTQPSGRPSGKPSTQTTGTKPTSKPTSKATRTPSTPKQPAPPATTGTSTPTGG